MTSWRRLIAAIEASGARTRNPCSRSSTMTYSPDLAPANVTRSARLDSTCRSVASAPPVAGEVPQSPDRLSDGSLMEAGSTDRDLHSDPQRRAKVHIYRQFPSETHIRRPSPRPFTQEIAGSNPDGLTSSSTSLLHRPHWQAFCGFSSVRPAPADDGSAVQAFVGTTFRCVSVDVSSSSAIAMPVDGLHDDVVESRNQFSEILLPADHPPPTGDGVGSANTLRDPQLRWPPADRTRPSQANRGHPTLATASHARPSGADQAVAHENVFRQAA